MKSKILLILVAIVSLFTINLSAAEDISKNVSVNYANLESMKVNEYQLVTIKVEVDNHWFNPKTTTVNINYDDSQLDLVNIGYTNNKLETTQLSNPEVQGDTNSFTVDYQFYLQPNANIEQSQVEVIQKTDDGESISDLLTIDANSLSTWQDAIVGDNHFQYRVNNYDDTGEVITLNAEFNAIKLVDSLFYFDFIKNNMSVDDDQSYTINFTGDGNFVYTEKAIIDGTLQTGDNFKVDITANKSELDSKNDRFEFLLFITSGENSVRLEPTFFPNEFTETGSNTKRWKFVKIENIWLLGLIGLGVLHYRQSKLATSENDDELPVTTDA